jgi:hypothetical protein
MRLRRRSGASTAKSCSSSCKTAAAPEGTAFYSALLSEPYLSLCICSAQSTSSAFRRLTQPHSSPPSVPGSANGAGASGSTRLSPFGSTPNSNGGLFCGLGAVEASSKLSARERQQHYKHALDDQLRNKASNDSLGMPRSRSTPRSLPSARTEATADELSPCTAGRGAGRTMLSFGVAEEERTEKRRLERAAYALALQQQISDKKSIRTEFDPFNGAAHGHLCAPTTTHHQPRTHSLCLPAPTHVLAHARTCVCIRTSCIRVS